jgi:hypothetical protein
MDNVNGCDKNKDNHHVEGSSTSYNDNFSTLAQVLDSTQCGKKERS